MVTDPSPSNVMVSTSRLLSSLVNQVVPLSGSSTLLNIHLRVRCNKSVTFWDSEVVVSVLAGFAEAFFLQETTVMLSVIIIMQNSKKKVWFLIGIFICNQIRFMW